MTELLEPINFGEYEVKKYSHGRGSLYIRRN